MSRNSGNASSVKMSFPGAGNNSKPNRKSFRHSSESSNISSDRNSSARSEDMGIPDMSAKPQIICDYTNEEQEHLIKKLKEQVKELRHKLRVLEESVDSKDYSLGTIAREKDRAMGEIRRLERSNKQLRQQLNDERSHYLEEKEQFCAEMTRYKKKLQEAKVLGEAKKAPAATKQPLINQSLRWQLNNEKGDFADVKAASSGLLASESQNFSGNAPLSSFTLSESQLQRTASLKSAHLYEGDDVSLQIAALRTENVKLRSIICERDERNYELCLRFLRMKHYKNDIKSRFHDLENEYLQVIANLMDKIDEARQEFNFIIDQKFKRPLHSTNAMYLQLVQKNSRMAFENASLRLENQCLKKKLNKYANGVSDYYRKPDEASTDSAHVGVLLKNSDSDGKLKRTKKNVNFKEIRTIYERNFAFKNSDTDSNYKKQATVSSNRSLPDAKSVESIIECEQEGQEKASTSFQANSLPEEILTKIFKRIDTPSCQTIDSERSKGITSSGASIKGDTARETPKEKSSTSFPDLKSKRSQWCDRKRPKEDAFAKTLENKHKGLPNSTSTSYSKESLELKEHVNSTSSPPTELVLRTNDAMKECALLRDDRQTLGELKNGTRTRMRNHERENGAEASGVRSIKRNVLGRHEKMQRSNQDREFLQRHSRIRNSEFKDCCGLKEKLDISDKELPSRSTGESSIQMTADLCKGEREKAEDLMARIDLRESLDEDEDEDESVETSRRHSKYLSPAVGSRSKSSNKVNLQDELMDALRHQAVCGDRARVKEMRSKSSTGSIANEDKKMVAAIERAASGVPHTRRTEGSKRFSHRLISTSPETLKNILTESQLGGSYRMGPFVVGHATTEMDSAFKSAESPKEIFLQFLIPKPTAGQFSQVHASKEERVGKITAEKETSMSGLITVNSTTRLDVPTSNNTMELIESVAIDKNDIMLRTLSAPGLLESGWLDQYAFPELKDSSTNT